MKKISTLVFLAVMATGCSASGSNSPKPAISGPPGSEVSLNDANRTAVETAIRDRLGQPSTTFRTMIGQRDTGGGVTVCGYFNSGSGDTPFIGVLASNGFQISNLGGSTEDTIAVQKACHGRGIYI